MGFDKLQSRWSALRPDVRAFRMQVEGLQRRAALSIANQQAQKRDALNALAAQLEMLNPQRTLERGYAIVTGQDGAILRAPSQLLPRDSVTVRLAEGSAEIEIAAVKPAAG